MFFIESLQCLCHVHVHIFVLCRFVHSGYIGFRLSFVSRLSLLKCLCLENTVNSLLDGHLW